MSFPSKRQSFEQICQYIDPLITKMKKDITDLQIIRAQLLQDSQKALEESQRSGTLSKVASWMVSFSCSCTTTYFANSPVFLRKDFAVNFQKHINNNT